MSQQPTSPPPAPVTPADELAKLRELVRVGKLPTARALLRDIARRRVAREHAGELAQLSRQSGLPMLGLRLLRRYVRPPRPLAEPATPMERTEYAVCLSEIGAGDEAMELLRQTPWKEYPPALFYRTFVHFSRWDYPPAIEELREFLRLPGLSERQVIVGKLNLGAALVHERQPDEAQRVLDEVLRASETGEWRRYYGSALELAAQNAVLNSRWQEARGWLVRGFEALTGSGGINELFLHKWEAILDLRRSPGETTLAKLAELRVKAADWPHWETVRDCDRWAAVATSDQALIRHVYFGTPYPNFRKRMLADLAQPIPLPEHYDWIVSGKARAKVRLDLLTGDASGGPALRPGQVPHRLLSVLASDFYRPSRLTSLFARLHPGEYFDPASSPFRVYQALERLRGWFSENALPLTVEESKGMYALRSAGPIAIRIPREPGAAPQYAAALARLRKAFGDKPFRAREAGGVLAIAERTARLLLGEMVESELVSREGKSAATRYRVR